jgi:hypothetical protein
MDTLRAIPKAIQLDIRELPPALTKGRVRPVTGKSPMLIPIFSMD